MAEENTLTQGVESTIPRLKLGQTSYNGLWTLGGNVFEDCQQELRWPHAIHTYKKMAKDATIAPALNLVEMAIARVPWTVKIPEGYEDQLKDKAEFLRQCMNDMEHSWGAFIRQCVTFNRYGFSVHEKVYRRRLKQKGSKYNDGLIGIQSLPIIAQDTIDSWDWDDEGRKLTGLYQLVVKPTGKDKVQYIGISDDVFIPRKKFLHFRNQPIKDDPCGQSPLANCWWAWKFKTALEEQEAMGISSDLRGLRVLYIPPRYMAEDASPEDKAVYEEYKKIMRNIHMNEQSGLILPQVLDEQGEQYFKFDVISITGQKAHDVHAVINRYKNEIISSLMASQLVLGQDGGGSFSLAESLQGISDMAVESKLIEIQEQLNHDLVPQLFSLNGWSTEVLPYFEFGRVKDTDLDVLSKYVQRVASVGLLPKTPDVVNYLTEEMGVPAQFAPDEDQMEMDALMTGATSRAGDGLSTPGEGTSTSVIGADDASAGNMENS
jgi:hypothetical protein